MKIMVCPLSMVAESVASRAPVQVVSLLDPEFEYPELGPEYVDRHLRLRFHDIHVPTPEQVMPSSAHVRDLLDFLEPWDPRDLLPFFEVDEGVPFEWRFHRPPGED